MQLIKKYANRKLYHTNRKRYITLAGIARLVQAGEEVRIVDNESGEDITNSILAQVVLHQRGNNHHPLPATILTGLIQVGGDTISNVRRTLFSSLGGADLVDTEISRRIAHLEHEGIIDQREAERLRTLLLRKSEPVAAPNAEFDLPSRNDVTALHQQVDALAATIERLLNTPGNGKADTSSAEQQ